MNSQIIIENYSEEWPRVFQELKAAYKRIPGSLISEIHHVGSTSVPGLASKPVIDIDIIIDSREALPELIKVLEKKGYEYAGDLGIAGREAFLQRSEKSPEDGRNRVWPAHHLYACTKDNIAFQNHMMFRDYLRQNPIKAGEYGELKKKLAAAHESDRNLYTEKKTEFIIEALREMGFEEKKLEKIISQNRDK